MLAAEFTVHIYGSYLIATRLKIAGAQKLHNYGTITVCLLLIQASIENEFKI